MINPAIRSSKTARLFKQIKPPHSEVGPVFGIANIVITKYVIAQGVT